MYAQELLDIAASHASGEEVVGAIFDRLKGKAKRDEDTDKGASNHLSKKKNKQRHKGSLMSTADRKGVRSPLRAPQTTSRSRSKDNV